MPDQIVEILKQRGLKANEKTISDYAHSGKIPFGQSVPGNKKGIMFPEENLDSVLAKVPKKMILAEGQITKHWLVKKAREMGLSMNTANIDTYLKKIAEGKEPVPKGLFFDKFDSHRRVVIPKAVAFKLLKDAKRRKALPKLLETGKIVPLSKIATDLGLSPRSLHGKKGHGISSFRIGNGRYVAAKEAERFKAEFISLRENGRRYKSLVQKKPVSTVGVKNAAKPVGKKTARPKQVQSANSLMQNWFNENSSNMSQGRRKLIERVIRQSKNVSVEEYYETVLPLFERIFYR